MKIYTNDDVIIIDGEGATIDLGSSTITSDDSSFIVTNFNFENNYDKSFTKEVVIKEKLDPIRDRFEILDL